MNANKDRWESYTDKTGRRHWRGPATHAASERDGRDVDVESRKRTGWPAPLQANFAALLARGK